MIYASYLTLSVMSLVSKVIKTAHSVLYSHPLEGQYQVLVEGSNVLLFPARFTPFFARCSIMEALRSCDLNVLVLCLLKTSLSVFEKF